MIEIKNLNKTFHTSDGDVEALHDVSITIPDGDIYGIIGMSGAGKSTLVRCINMLERPTSGQVIIDGTDVGALDAAALRELRRNTTMIFQGFNLLMQRNCLKNICFPLELSGVNKADAKKKAMELLETVGLADKAKVFPAQLSGGQQQRIAIARALATNPKVLLCDEATSALDPTTTNSILRLLQEINEKLGITIIIITHQMSVVESICRHVAILDGGVVAEEGEVGEVFSHPKSAAAKKLVFPEGDSASMVIKEDGEQIIRVVYNGAPAAGTPMVAKLAAEMGIAANIAYASTRTINGKAYGSMLLGIRGGEDNVRRAIEYMTSVSDITAEVVKDE